MFIQFYLDYEETGLYFKEKKIFLLVFMFYVSFYTCVKNLIVDKEIQRFCIWFILTHVRL